MIKEPNQLRLFTQDIPSFPFEVKTFLLDLERHLVGLALEETGGNKLEAAKLLKMKRTTLVEKCKRFGIRIVNQQLS
jgi:sigma-54 specific flagellar transcriptional regulator A